MIKTPIIRRSGIVKAGNEYSRAPDAQKVFWLSKVGVEVRMLNCYGKFTPKDIVQQLTKEEIEVKNLRKKYAYLDTKLDINEMKELDEYMKEFELNTELSLEEQKELDEYIISLR